MAGVIPDNGMTSAHGRDESRNSRCRSTDNRAIHSSWTGTQSGPQPGGSEFEHAIEGVAQFMFGGFIAVTAAADKIVELTLGAGVGVVGAPRVDPVE